MDTITGSLIILLFTLTGVVGGIVAWQRGHRRCVVCHATILRIFPYCPWCSQMQFSKTRTPVSRTPVIGEQQRRRASLPTGERLALLLHRKKGTQGKGAPPSRGTRAAAGTIVLSQGSKEARIVRTPEPTMRDTTVRTTLTSLASCSRCGHRIEGVETFCGQCGWSLNEGNTPQ